MGCIPMISKRAFAGRWIGCGRILGFTASAWTLWRSRVAPLDYGCMEAAPPRSRHRTLPGEIEDAVVEEAFDVEKILIDGLIPQEAAAAVRAAE
jgi:hypothetical protein